MSQQLQSSASTRRLEALFKALSSDFLLREQFITDPAQIVAEYVTNRRLDPEQANSLNLIIYSFMSNQALVHWLRHYSGQRRSHIPSPAAFLRDLGHAIVQHGGHQVVFALLGVGSKINLASTVASVLPFLFGPDRHGGPGFDIGPTTGRGGNSGPTTGLAGGFGGGLGPMTGRGGNPEPITGPDGDFGGGLGPMTGRGGNPEPITGPDGDFGGGGRNPMTGRGPDPLTGFDGNGHGPFTGRGTGPLTGDPVDDDPDDGGPQPITGPDPGGGGPQPITGPDPGGGGPQPITGPDPGGGGPQPITEADPGGGGPQPITGADPGGGGPQPITGADPGGGGPQPITGGDPGGSGPTPITGDGPQPITGTENGRESGLGSIAIGGGIFNAQFARVTLVGLAQYATELRRVGALEVLDIER